ncbi:MAG TPA: CRISPR-associated protein Cas4 [Kiritimatiellia bacterium]|nr:CRISPR-associated protein Cas4 [Kiritimatiellia bacterium]
MPYSEDDLLPLSALQHLLYCERQCALIHIEQVWSENRFTAEGRLAHDHVHSTGHETRGDMHIARDLSLRSLRLGLIGKADVVEFHGATPYPVEHKRGHSKSNRCDEVQVCAQALCLEEMLGKPVPEGALFYGEPRRRTLVTFDPALRAETEAAAARLHRLLESGRTPPAVYDKAKCERCSLLDLCKPRIAGDVSRYLSEAVR